MARKVLAVLQVRDGVLHRASWEALAAAQRLAGDDGEVHAALLGDQLDGIAEEVRSRALLSAVHVAAAPSLAPYTPGAHRQVLSALGRELSCGFVLFAHTYQSVDLMGRLAQELEAALVPEVVDWIEPAGEVIPHFRRPVFGGKLQATVRVKVRGNTVLSVQAGAFPAGELRAADPENKAPIHAVMIDPSIAPDRDVLGVEDAAGETVDLSRAEIIVAAGRGVGGAEKMEPLRQLAAALGAEIGASRPVIDNGWLPRDRQIGSSGQTVAPKLYFAVGISGAIQHMVGMKGANVVVAINKDPGAPIFSVARYGLVGDLHEIVPAVTEAIRQAKAN